MKRKRQNTLNILWLTALLLFVPVVGMILNYGVFKWRSILLLLVWAVVLLTPYIIARKKWLYITASSLIFCDGLINLFHWIILKCPLNASSIFVFLNTNFDEASEFMAIKMTPLLLLTVVYILLYICTLRNIPKLAFKRKGERIVWSACWLLIVVFFADNIIHGRFLRLAVPEVERAFVSFLEESKEYKGLKTRALFDIKTELRTDEPTLVVVIVGESCNRNHMSLYGYGRETSPRLRARTDILAFDNVVSANSNTLRSVMNFMTESNNDRPQSLDSCVHIFDVLHSSPYKSFWLSNQTPIGLWDNGVTNLAQNADVTTFVNISSSSSKESTMTVSLDERLFDPLRVALADTARHKVVFLHLMGNHTQYSKRYPRNFEIFNKSHDRGEAVGNNDDKRRRVIDSYDNAILYNDYVVDSILSILDGLSKRRPDIRISALYFSDHGENVYDEGDYSGHDYSEHIPRANVEIPFILWFSPSQRDYLEGYCPELAGRIHSPYMIDDLFHTMIDLATLSTECLEPSRSIISPNFNDTRQRVLEDGSVYLPCQNRNEGASQ